MSRIISLNVSVHRRAIALILASLLILGAEVAAQSLSDIRIGDSIGRLKVLGSSPIAEQPMGPHTARKYLLPDRNYLSVTYRRSNNTVAYLETDWGGQQSGSFSDFGDFRFGETSLNDIGRQLGHNGMAYVDSPGTTLTNDGDLVSFNSYEIGSSKLVVTFVTKIKKNRLAELQSRDNDSKIGSLLGVEGKLDSIILSDSSYLEGIWGTKKIYDSKYRPIQWRN